VHTAFDRGLVPHPEGGYVRPKEKEPTAIDEIRNVEVRSVFRQMPERERSERYRRLVMADDPLARKLEDDPVGLLVSDGDRKWARQVRIDRAPEPVKQRLALLQATMRAHALLLETAQRTLREATAESAIAV
jgi:hypothetical protein